MLLAGFFMTQQIINVGTGPDSYTGDTLRTAFEKTNSNFTELYSTGGISSNANLSVRSLTSTGNVTAAHFIGDGSLLTGIVAGTTYSNSNVASYLPTYSGNVNAAYYFGNGRNITGIVATANLGNLTIDGITNQTLTGMVPGSLILRPFDGNVVAIQTQFDATGITSNLLIGSLGINSLGIRPAAETNGVIANLTLAANLASVTFNSQTNSISFNTSNNTGYAYRFNNGSLYSREFYAEANFPTGYQFTTPGGDTGLSHTYDTTQGNISLIRIRHDNAVPAKFYENLTSVLSGNLVVSQSGNVFGTFPNAFIQAYSSANTYTQLVWQNLNSNAAATGDIVVTADTGTDTTYYIDMGMTSSGYDNTNPDNSLGTSINPLDGYFYVQGSEGNVGGNLTLGTTTPGTNVKILVGGVDSADVIATFSNVGMDVTGNIGATGNIVFSNNYVYNSDTFTSPETNGILKSFKWKFSDLAYGADTVTLKWNNLGTTFPQWYLTTNSEGNIYVFDGDAKTIGYVDGGSTSGTVTFGSSANNGAGGSNDIELTTVTGNAYVRAGSNSWQFSGTGDLTAPGNISVGNILAQNIRTIEGTVHLGQGAGLADQGTYAIAVGRFAGSQTQGGAALAIGQLAGQTSQGQSAIALGLYAAANAQSTNAVAIGTYAGRNTQGENSVAIGILAGNNSQGGSSVAVGPEAGTNAQGQNAVAVGSGSGLRNQGTSTVAVGSYAGQYDQSNFAVALGSGAAYNGQGTGAIAIGTDATPINQGDYSIAIGAGVSTNAIQPDNSIIIDATASSLAATGAGLFINPVRRDVGNIGNIATYNTTTKELTYTDTIGITGNISGGNLSVSGNITGKINGYEIGYRNIPQLEFAGDVQVSADDSGKHYYNGTNTDYTVSILDSGIATYPVGTSVTIVNKGTGNVLVWAYPGVSLYMAGNATAGNRTVGDYGMATLLNVDTDVWMINGTGIY